jgi:outer membrane protein OmpA-like peptidoglycan-associated protein
MGGGGGARSPQAGAEPRARTRRGPPALVDDAAHAHEFAEHAHPEWFTEWWYFNVRDPKTGVAFFAMYEHSPFGLGLGAFAALCFPPGAAPFDVEQGFPSSQVSTSAERPDVKLGPNAMHAIDADTYRIVASTPRLSYDLVLERVDSAGPAWLLDDARGPLAWEQGFWMTWLPHARARGTVTIDGVTHTIDGAAAYHDHNWGVWCSPIRNWQWMQCSSATEPVALDLGYSDGFDPPRVALLDLDGRTYAFDYAGIEVPTYADFRTWEKTPWKYPLRAETTLVDRDERVRVEVAWRAREGATAPLYASIVLFEQHVDVMLRVSHKEEGGGWGAPRVFELDGIAEWSDSYLAEWATGQALEGAYAAEATVFGGGISGLSVAHELVERGFAVTVVEPEQALDPKGRRAMAVGGMARSHYARVPRGHRIGPTPSNRPGGRPTPDAREDRWVDRRITFAEGSAALPHDAERAIADAARAFRDVYCDQGYRLRVTGGAAAIEPEPRALGARRAEAVRDRLAELGVSADHVALAEDARANRPDAVVSLEDWVLPGEHGFRFFAAYYRHLGDTLSRIPVYDADGRQTERRVADNLARTPASVTLRSGQPPMPAPAANMTSTQMLRMAGSVLFGSDYDPRDFVQMGLRIARYLATCPDRRKGLEAISWWGYLSGYCRTTRCYLYRYSNAFTNDATQSGRVLAAFDWRYGDARTNGSTWVQLTEPLPDGAGKFDGTLNAPTTEAWFVHWRRYLEERGVRFVAGSLERFDVEGERVVAWVKTERAPEAQPWRGRTRLPQYLVCATDAPTAERASKPLPKVGVPRGLVGYTTTYHHEERNPHREPGLGKDDRFQTLSGIQYFFDQDFAIATHSYSLDAPWSICSLSMQRAWGRLPFKERDGYAGLLSVDIGDFRVPAGPTQTTAWDSTKLGLADQVWMQITSDLRTDAVGSPPLRLPRPSWFHVDDNLEFGDRDGREGVVVSNATPYLVPITDDWKNRPGPEPFDPNVPNVRHAREHAPGVWTAPHGGYPVHFGSLVYAGIYLRTFTRMTTMESANESGRHAVNAILDHYNAHHGTSVAPPSPGEASPDPLGLSADEVLPIYLGDYCGIWNIERYENPSFDNLKAVDQLLFDLHLPHLFDLLGLELVPSILSHVLPYRGDFSSTTVVPPPPVPKPAWWCPPFVGQVLGEVRRRSKTRAR